MPTRYLPFFVYGTLLSSQPRHHLLGSVIRRQPARLTGGILRDVGRFPILLRGEGRVLGELCWLAREGFAERVALLDAYENVDQGEYERITWDVRPLRGSRIGNSRLGDSVEETIEAWVYLGLISGDFPQIPNGDWAAHWAKKSTMDADR